MQLGGIKVFIELFYRYLISPVIHLLAGPFFGCRFMPTCSEYGSEALQLHGWIAGSQLMIRRFCRCHPFSRAGYDPVPRVIANVKEKKDSKKTQIPT